LPASIAAIVHRHRGDLKRATHALIDAANDHGGEDNITAVLFEVERSEDGDTTVEAAAAAALPDPDDEDTLHPEDRVAAPVEPLDQPPPASVTRVVSFDEIRAALAAERGETPPAEDAAPAEPAEPETDPVTPPPVEHPIDEHPVDEPGPVPYQVPGPNVEPPPLRHLHDTGVTDAHLAASEPGEPEAGLGRKLFALLVIAALIALIVFLVMRGLAR
jgi:hypothetical protein